MSGMQFQRRPQVRPPQKGSFPLDHEGECKLFMIKYMRCMRRNNQANTLCRQESKDYLGCRMENNLMKKESWNKLGFSQETPASTSKKS